MEEARQLRSVVGPHGAHLYDTADIEALAQARLAAGARTRKPLGEIAADAFALFEQGYSVQDVVKKLRQSPELIRRLLQDYLTGYGEPPDAERERQDRKEREERELEKLYAEIDAEREREVAKWERHVRQLQAEAEREDRRERARASRWREELAGRHAAMLRRHLDR
jgi:chromosome segregation ATPase